MHTAQNSLTEYLCAYVSAMFDDMAYTYTVRRDWERDKTRLLHEIRMKGSQVLTILLPSVCKHLDQMLDQGLYQPSGLYLCKARNGEKVPVFLRDLFVQIFDPSDGMLRCDPNLAAISDLRQLLAGGKKLLLACSTRRIYDEVQDFYRTESGNRMYSLDWSSDAPLSTDMRLAADLSRPKGVARISFEDYLNEFDSQIELFTEGGTSVPSSRDELRLLQQTFDGVISAMGDFSEEEESHVPEHGTGAVSDIRRGMSKYQFEDWPSKLEAQYPPDYYAVHDFMCSEDLGDPGKWRNREVPSKLIAVPKTEKTPRLIASEPSQHQWIQQLLLKQLLSAIQRTPLRNCLNIVDQTPNQELAVAGSKGGFYTTVDLSSASDRLTCSVVERALRSNPTLLDRLHSCRTRWVRNCVDNRSWEYLILKKFSTQGSAVIFPMQSIVYACIAIASVRCSAPDVGLSHDTRSASSQVRIFGDDIIVPTYAYPCLLRYLTSMGLKVNQSKTFNGMNFRESCGVDAFRGVIVTPAFIRQVYSDARPSAKDSIIDVSNNFWDRGYWNTANWLRSFTRRWNHMIPIRHPSAGGQGYISFCGTSLDHLSRRYNSGLQIEEVRVFSTSKKARRTRSSARHSLHQWFTEKPRSDLPWEAGVDQAVVDITRPGWLPIRDFSL